MDLPAAPENEPIAKTVMTITMLHPQDLDPSAMSNSDVANHLSIGSFVGQRTSLGTSDVPDDEVGSELEALGGTPGHFTAKGPFLDNSNDA